MIPAVEYVEWIVGRPERATHDLATSDLRDGQPDPGRIVPSRLVDAPGPGPAVALDEQVADAYGVDESLVVTTAGATHAYWLAVAAALVGDDGDRIVVERPGYEPLHRTPEAHGASVGRFDRARRDGYALSPDRIEEAVDGATALVVATNRHNPSGRLADRETLAAAAETAGDAGARLLVDEVYAAYTETPGERAFGGPTAAGLDGAVVTGSLTKFHGLGGLRIGWVIADEPFLERVGRAYAHLPVQAAPSEALARRALANREGVEAGARERLRANHDLLDAFVAGRDDVDGPVYDGAPFAFLAHDAADGDAVVDAAWDRGILVVPGRFFDAPGRFRVSLGGNPDEMAAALDALEETLYHL